MDRAVSRLKKASPRENFVVWGDFDVDGQTQPRSGSARVTPRRIRQLSHPQPFQRRSRHPPAYAQNLARYCVDLYSLVTGVSAHDARPLCPFRMVMSIIPTITPCPKLYPTLKLSSPHALPEGQPCVNCPVSAQPYQLVRALYGHNPVKTA